MHVIIVYAADFRDMAAVRRILDVLVAAGLAPAAFDPGPVIGFKPSAWTFLENGLQQVWLAAAVAGDARALAAAVDARRAWDAPRWKAFRTLYQSDRPGGGAPPPPKLLLPHVRGGAETAAAVTAAVRSGRSAGAGRPAGATDDGEVVVVSDDDDDDDDGGGGVGRARGAPRPRLGA
jgi:hypothetical protein